MTDREIYYPNALKTGYTFCHLENFNYITHIHEGMEGLYVLHGQIQAFIDGKRYTLNEGDICIVAPFLRHAFRSVKYSDILGFSVQAENLLVKLPIFAEHYTLKNPIIRKGQYSPNVAGLFEMLLGEQGKNADLMVHAGMLNAIFGYLFLVDPLIPDDDRVLTDIDRVLLYLHDHIREPITLLQTAEDLGISQFKLSRLCNQEIGIGFNAYLRFMRVAMAKRCLAYTSLSMNEIALSIGFESLRTFNRAFSEETGITPRAYRLQHRERSSMDLSAKGQSLRPDTKAEA